MKLEYSRTIKPEAGFSNLSRVSGGQTPLIERGHSRPQRPRFFWSATSGPVQLHSGFEWICKHNRLRPEAIRFVKPFSEHAQSDGKSVNRGLPLLDLARGRDSWCWPKGAGPLGTRMERGMRFASIAHALRALKTEVENVEFWFTWTKIESTGNNDARLILRSKLNGATTRWNPNWNPNCNRGQLFRPCWIFSAQLSTVAIWLSSNQ